MTSPNFSDPDQVKVVLTPEQIQALGAFCGRYGLDPEPVLRGLLDLGIERARRDPNKFIEDLWRAGKATSDDGTGDVL